MIFFYNLRNSISNISNNKLLVSYNQSDITVMQSEIRDNTISKIINIGKMINSTKNTSKLNQYYYLNKVS